MLVDELEPADVAALAADAPHQADRIRAKFLEVAVFFFAAGDPRHVVAVVICSLPFGARCAPYRRIAKS